ncbi:HdeD family acid-resistance protein [Thiohalorhabdus sp. Cl-TMA]|uniref:HdeD family acid-resistance protein n=1 Tax=Thiohalorhabdus methylotrophus TaxID=3242694 RepID=A0ABV4TTQ4_9GAMM
MPQQGQTLDRVGLTGLKQLHHNWGWFLALGIGLIVLGAIALGSVVATTAVSIMVFGWLLAAAAILEVAFAFWQRTWGSFFIDLLMGILYGVVAFLVLANPGLAAVTYTLIIAMYLIVTGIFRVIAASATRYPGRGWLALHGVVAVILGVLIWQQWPGSGMWVIGMFIGIELIFNGWALLMLGIAAHRSPEEELEA